MLYHIFHGDNETFCLPDCWCKLLFGAAPKGSGNDPKLGFVVVGCEFGIVITFPKSAKFVFSCVDDEPLNGFAFSWVENESPPAFKLLLTFGGQFKFDVDWTGLLPVVGHGLVLSWAKLLDPVFEKSEFTNEWCTLIISFA